MTDTANRVLWTAVGLLLAAAGVLGVLASVGRLPGADADAPLLAPALVDLWRQHRAWTAAAIIAAGLMVAALGVWLLRRELRRHAAPRVDRFDLTRTGGRVGGRTTVRAAALAHGMERDLARRRLGDAAVDLTGRPDAPGLYLRLKLSDPAELPAARRAVDAAVARFARTTGVTPRPPDVTARVHVGRAVR